MAKTKKISLLFSELQLKIDESNRIILPNTVKSVLAKFIAALSRQNLNFVSSCNYPVNKIIFFTNFIFDDDREINKRDLELLTREINYEINKIMTPDEDEDEEILKKSYNKKILIEKIASPKNAGIEFENYSDFKKSLFKDRRIDLCFIHTSTSEQRSNIDHAFNGEPLLNFHNKHTDFDCDIFSFDLYFNCSSILKAVISKNSMQHLVIIKGESNNCYSKIITDSFHNKKSVFFNQTLTEKRSPIESISIISNETFHDPVVNEKINGHFNFTKNIYKISEKKNIPNGSFLNSLLYWSKLYCYPPSCFFAYGEKDNYHLLMKEIEFVVKRYFPFLSFRKDKETKNHYMNIEQYSKELFKGDIIIHVIGENYFGSFYAMRELTKTLQEKNLISKKNGNFEASDFTNIASHGLIPVLSHNARDFVLSVDFKKQVIKKIKEHSDYDSFPKSDMRNIRKSLNSIQNLFSKIYSFKTIESMKEESFSVLIEAIRKAVVNGRKGMSYPDIYETYEDNKFPPPIEKPD